MQESTSPGSKLEWALWSARRGRRVFPVRPNGKVPLIKDWPGRAITEEPQIRTWWGRWPDANIGIACGDGLLVLDLDVKHGKNGIAAALALFGPDVFVTFTVATPTGGRHLYLQGPDMANTVGQIGEGIDVRSEDGFVVAPGSQINGKPYTVTEDMPLADAPSALLGMSRVRDGRNRTENAREPLVELDQPDAIERGRKFLQSDAPLAVQDHGGDTTTFKVAARLKDFGLSESMAFDLMAELWNDRGSPPWEIDGLADKVANVFLYGKNRPGCDSPAYLYGDLKIEPVPPRPGRHWFDEGDDHTGAVSWLYRDLLPTTGVAILSAPSGAGKTFVALHLAKSLAMGTAFFANEPANRGGTMILVGEAYGSLKLRLAALGEPQRRLPIAATYVGGLAARGAWSALCEDVRAKANDMAAKHGVPIRLIILDTLSSSGMLDDENNNALAATALKAFHELSTALQALLIVVHHPPKSGEGERGAGAIRNNADYVLTITHNPHDKVREIEITKSRDSECRALGTFTLVPVTVEGGATTMTVSPGEPRIKRSASSAKAERFRTIFEQAYEAEPLAFEGRRAVRACGLREAIAGRMPKPDPSNIRRTIRDGCGLGRFDEIEIGGVACVAECPFDLAGLSVVVPPTGGTT